MIKQVYRVILVFIFVNGDYVSAKNVSGYLSVLEQSASKPAEYVVKKLDEYDLVLFDDSNHQAKEPFDFYQTLFQNKDFFSAHAYRFYRSFRFFQTV